MAKKAKKAKTASGEPKSKKPMIMMIIITLLVIGVARFAALIFLVGIFPSIIANMVDRSPRKAIFQTVFACNLAGVLPYLGELMALGNNIQAVESKMSDLYVWCAMYIAAAMGWVLVLMTPRIMDLVLSASYAQKVTRLTAEQKKLVEDWGPEVQRKDAAAAA